MDVVIAMTHVTLGLNSFRKGTPVARPVRNATGLSETAGLPKRTTPPALLPATHPRSGVPHMRKRFAAPVLAVAGLLASSAIAFAAVNFDSSTGTGFVGKGDVQLAFGWNNKQLQDNVNAGLVTFKYNSEDSYDITCEWETVTGGRNSQVIPHAVDIHKTQTVKAAVALDPRVRNQITGLNLTGFGDLVTTGPAVPAVGDACPQAHATALVTAVSGPTTTGGLYVSFNGTDVPMPNTPIVTP
jgi:hypothetical protein